MRVSVDATALLDRPTGVGVFVGELVHGLAGAARSERIVPEAFAVSVRARRLRTRVPAGIGVRARPVPARPVRSLWRHGDRPTAADLGAIGEIVHGPNHVVPPAPGAVEIVTVHDLTAVHHPHLCTPEVLAWPGLLDRAVRRGAWVHTPTAAVAAEVRERWPLAADRVVAIHHGIRRPTPVGADVAAAQAAVGRHIAGAERYVLALGTVEPRKNLPAVVRAFERVAADRPDVGLVVAGPDGWGIDEFVEVWHGSPFRRRIRRVGWVDAAMRTALIRGASVVAQASVYEGFGFVPLESLVLGTPVVATRIAAVLEVTGDAARLVEPGDDDAFAAGLAGVLDDPSIAEPQLERGRAVIDRLDWARTIREMIALYRRARAG